MNSMVPDEFTTNLKLSKIPNILLKSIVLFLKVEYFRKEEIFLFYRVFEEKGFYDLGTCIMCEILSITAYLEFVKCFQSALYTS